jgi:hypothetical protein
LLVQEFQWLNGITQFTIERSYSSARPAHEAEIDDIIGILDVVDTRNALAGYMFVASNLQAMPKCGPEELKLAVVIDRHVQMESVITNMSASVQKLSTYPLPTDSSAVVQQSLQSVAFDMQQQFGAFNYATGARLDHLTTVCTQLTENATSRSDKVSCIRHRAWSRPWAAPGFL